MSITYGNNASGSGLNSFGVRVDDDLFSWLQVNSDQVTTIDTNNNTLELQEKFVNANTVLAGGNGSVERPVFRLLSINDLPTFQLHYNITEVTSVGGAPTTFDTFTLPANTYSNVGHVVTSLYGGTLPLQISTYSFNFVGILDSVNTFSFSGISIVSGAIQTGSWNISCNTIRIDSDKIRTVATLNMSVGTQNYTFSRYTELTLSGGFTVPQTMALTCQTNVTGTAVFKLANVINNI